MTRLEEIRMAMIALKVSGDSVFNRVREELARGNLKEARACLNFVDVIVDEGGKA